MTSSERETAGTVRSAHVAYFLPPDWHRVARIATPALDRIVPDSIAVQLLVLVPDSGAALALARALAELPAGAGRRVVAATSAARTKRLLAAGGAQVVIGAPAVLAPAVAASVLKLDEVTSVLFASADEFSAEDADVATILTEVPKGVSRLMTALEPSSSVEALLERYMHKARRVFEDVAADDDAPTAPAVRFLSVSGSPIEALPGVLDDVDAPSATVVATDAASVAAAERLLGAIGYRDSGLAVVTEDAVPMNSALVVLLGVPTALVWANVVAAQPATIVAIITPRDRAALQRLAGSTVVQPFAARAAVLKARASDARARAELRELLAEGIPSREVLALEPLLGEYEGLEIAAAALRLLDRTRASQAELVRSTEQRVYAVMKEAQAARDETAGRPERGGPRSFAPRGDGPRGDGPRGERPRGDKPRGDKPRGPRRDDAPRGPRGPR